MDPTRGSASWWGAVDLSPGQTRFWEIGPLSLWLQRNPREWRITFERGADPLAGALRVAIDPPREPGPDAEVMRFGFRDAPGTVRLSPVVADLPLITRPRHPLLLLAGEEIELYVGSPVGIEVSVGTPSRALHEIVAFPLSETWFGPSTRTGEICYASRTSARMDLSALPLPPHRAVSEVRVRNRASTPLTLEMVRLPTPNLSLYDVGEINPWTQAVTLTRGEDDDEADMSLDDTPPRRGIRLHGPRLEPGRNLLVRAFGGLFERRGEERDA